MKISSLIRMGKQIHKSVNQKKAQAVKDELSALRIEQERVKLELLELKKMTQIEKRYNQLLVMEKKAKQAGKVSPAQWEKIN